MTGHSPAEAPHNITPADREGAWPFRPACYQDNDMTRANWTAGAYDEAAKIISAFAQHRESHLAMAQDLQFSDRGDLELKLVWALKPGQPKIIAVCTQNEAAERYKAVANIVVPGATGYIEDCVANHAFGRNDIQSAVYRGKEKHRD